MARTTKPVAVKAARKAKAVAAPVKKLSQKQIDQHAQDLAEEKEEKAQAKESARKCKLYTKGLKDALASQGIKTRRIETDFNGGNNFNVFFTGDIKVGGDESRFEGTFDFDGVNITNIGYEGPEINSYNQFEQVFFESKPKGKVPALVALRKAVDDNSADLAASIVFIIEQKKIVKDFNERIVLALNSFTKMK